MEWFIPSLLVLVLSAIVLFIFMPRWSPYTLGLLSFGLFFLGVWQHYSMFPYEYKGSSLQSSLQDYAPFVMLSAVIVGGTLAVMLSWGGNPPSVAMVANSIPGVASLTGVPANKGSAAGNNRGSNGSLLGMGNRKNNIASSSFKTV